MIPRFEPTAGPGEILSFLKDVAFLHNSPGEATREFEKSFARYQGCEHAVFVPSGRVSLWLLLKALNYPEGSEIVLPAFTYFAMPAAVRFAGLKPVFADIDPATYELTAESVRAVLTHRTKAVLPTHLFGRTCPLNDLQKICGPAGVDIIEDCAQAFGARVGGRKAGCVGRAACFTFGITKNFTTFSGGMLACREKDVYGRIVEIMREFRGASKKRLFKEGVTSLAMWMATRRLLFNVFVAPVLKTSPSNGPDRIHIAFEEKMQGMTEETMRYMKWTPVDSQARAGMKQLLTLDAKNEARRRRGTELLRLLKQAGCEKGLPLAADADGDHIFMSFAITRPDRYLFASRLRKHGVDVSPGYMSDCSGMKELGGVTGLCSVSQAVERDILHLPMYPGLRDRDLRAIADATASAERGE